MAKLEQMHADQSALDLRLEAIKSKRSIMLTQTHLLMLKAGVDLDNPALCPSAVRTVTDLPDVEMQS